MTLHSCLVCYLLAINAVTFIVYGIDKYKAKKAKWRISEATLLLLAVLGGSVGAWGGNESLAPQDDAQEIQIWHSCHSAYTDCAYGVFTHESLKTNSLKEIWQ